MPFVPLSNEGPARRGFTPLGNSVDPAAQASGFTPISRTAPSIPVTSDAASSLPGVASADSPAARFADLPEARAIEPSWFERLAAGFSTQESLSQNIGDLLTDRIPEMDPSTGKLLTLDERRAQRLAFEARRADALGVAPPAADYDIGASNWDIAQATAAERAQQGAQLLGAMAKEVVDPIALLTGPIGAEAKGLARLATLAGVGGAYEGVSAVADQVSNTGGVTSPGDVALRAAAGAVITPALDALIRGVGNAVKRLLEKRSAAVESGQPTEELDAQIREGVTAISEEADKAGVPREAVTSQLIEAVQTPEGAVGVPRRDVFELPAPTGEPARGFTPLADEVVAPEIAIEAAQPPRAPDAPSQRQLADEYDRLARATTDPVVRTELLGKASAARATADGVKPKLSPKERSDAAKRVNPSVDTLDTAIRKMGGLDTARETDWQGRLLDAPKVFGLGALERPGKGQTLDSLAERLWELGYLRENNQGELAGLLSQVERGGKVYSMNAPAEARIDVSAQHTDKDFVFTSDAVDPREANTDFVIDTDNGTVVPARPIDFEDLRRLDEDERNAADYFERERGDAGPDQQPGGLPATGNVRPQERVALSTAGRAGDQPGPAEGFRLDNYSADDLRAELERRAGVEAEGAGARRADDTRAAADQARNEFTLTGSDRLADANPAQRDIMDYTGAGNERAASDVRESIDTGGATAAGGRRADTLPANVEILDAPGADPASGMASTGGAGPRVKYTATGKLPTGTRQVKSAADVAHVTAQLRKEPQESLLAVVTDGDGNVLRVVRHSVGSRNSSMADIGLLSAAAHSTPGARDVWFVHQHPSGSTLQSDADQSVIAALTANLRGTGIESRGMVVVAPGGRYSFSHPDPNVTGQTRGAPIPASPRNDAIDIQERRFARVGSGGAPVNSSDDLIKAMMKHSGGYEGVLLLDTQHTPVGFVAMSKEDMTRLRQGENSPAADLYQALDETNASATAAIIEDPSPEWLDKAHGNLSAFSRGNARYHLDTVNADGDSAVIAGSAYVPTTFYANPFDQALKYGVNTLRNNTASAVPGALAGGMYAGAESDEEPGSARWWVDVGFGAMLGAVGSATFFDMARRARITGKGGIADRGLDQTGRFLGKLLGRGPSDLEAMKQQQRLMRELLDRQTGEMGMFLRDHFTPSERGTMADLIENRGIVPDLNRVHTQAKALDDYLSFVTQKMKGYGMLPEHIEEGGYLHRYYAKHLGLDKTFKEAKRQSLSGSYTIARGMVDTFGHEYMSPGVKTLSDEMESLLAEKSLLERGLYERAAKLRGAREVDSGAVLTLPDEAVLRAPPGNATTGGKTPRYPSMSVDDAMARMGELETRLRALRKNELVEMVGGQNGKPRSFFFTKDELGRVESGLDPVLARMFKQEPAAPGVPRLPGETTAPPAPNMADLAPTERAWSLHSTSRDGVKLRRDWTARERAAWGEIKDAGYRFTRGMAEASHDLSLGKFFRDVSRRKDWVSAEAMVTKEGPWVQVPKGKARTGAGLERYGALSGQYVRPDIWRAMKRYGVSPRVLGALGDVRIAGTGSTVDDAYRAGLSKWKLWHTVYNPVSHVNNTYSNTEMLYMGGYGPGDLARGIQELARGENSEIWREARDAGLLDTDFGSSVLMEKGAGSPLEQIAEQLRNQRDDSDASLAVDAMMRMKEWWINSKNAVESADSRWSSGLEVAKAMARPVVKGAGFLKKPVDVAAHSMRKAYRVEDNVFKLAVFAAERKAGKSLDEARQAANDLFFDYNDIPDVVKFVRDFPIGSPFLTYTYKAIPALARNVVRHPERVLGLIMAYEAANYTALVNSGMDPDKYLETMDAYDETLPPWDGGRSLWGARNFVVMPGASNLLALGRSHAVGNPFMSDAGERRASVPGVTSFWGSDIFGGNPLHSLYDITVNEDWRGKPIYDEGAPDSTKRKAAAAYLYQSWAPSNILTPGSYHQTKVLEGLANDAREAPDGVAGAVVNAANGVAEALGMQRYTGLTRSGEGVDSGQAALGTLGVKLRDIQTEKSVSIEGSQLEKKAAKAEQHLDNQARLRSEGRITPEAFDEERRKVQEDVDRLKTEREELIRARDVLKAGGLLDKQRDQSSVVDETLKTIQQQLAELSERIDQRAAPSLEGMEIQIAERDPETGRGKRFVLKRSA